MQGGPGGLSGKDAITSQDRAHPCCLGTGDMYSMIDHGFIKDLRDDIVRTLQRLEPFDAGEILRHDLDDLNSRDFLFQPPAGTRNGATRSDARNDMTQLAIGLSKNLRSGRLEVGKPIVVVGVLVAMEVPTGLALRDAMSLTKRLVISL